MADLITSDVVQITSKPRHGKAPPSTKTLLIHNAYT